MAGSTPFVLPQYQGSMYDLQRQQALANALMQGALTQPQAPQPGASGQYQVAARTSPLAPVSNLAQGLLANKIGQQAGQGLNQLGQNQWQSLIGALGGGAAAQSPQLNPGSADGGVGVAGSVVNPFNGADGSNGTPGAAAAGPVNGVSAGPQLANNVGGNAPLNPLGMNPQLAAMMLMQSPDKYFESQAAAYKQAEIVPQLRAAGIDPNSDQGHALAKALIEKNNYIAPITGTGTFRDPRTMQPVAFNPDVPAGSTPLFDATGNVAAVRPIQGAQAAMQGNAAATAAGGAQFKPVQVYNPQTQQMEFTNEAQVTNPVHAAIVQTESNGNPNAVSPKGAQGAWQIMPNTKSDPGFGVRPAANNSPAELDRVGRDYYDAMAQRYGSPALGAIAYNMGPGATDTWLKNGAQFEKLPAETRNYVGKVVTLTALNSGAGNQGAAPTQQQPARFAAGAPMGAQASAESLAKGQVDTMQKSYQNLQTVRSGAPAALQDVDNMSKLAAGASPLTLGASGAKFAGLFSPNAAEYEKSRDNLVTNLGSQLGINSDAARDLVYGSIPSYGAPKQAVQNGLETLRGQIQTRLLKSDYLSDAYGSGDAKTYNQKENTFDQHMSPATANQIARINAMPAGQQKADALRALKGNANFEWAASNGILK
jgi:soluble lytic murein transglycosylase-like protein